MSVVDYRPLGDVYDEMLDPAGRPRPHWEHLADAFAEIGLGELQRRRAEAARLLDQDGVVYNAYLDEDELGAGLVDDEERAAVKPRPRSWRLDPLPTILSSREWTEIEAGVIERAELLSMILEDIYGKRELLRRRLIPPELIFGHSGFLRACDGIRTGGGAPNQQLFSYAADLGRDASGNVVVLGMRWRTARSSPGCCPRSTATARSTAWRRSSAPCGRGCRRPHRRRWMTRGSSCSPPAR
jgi:uncharacterized circularly permuted ATP-grasp superfamily protein